jgi:single-stranded-DNA-specific exonuclease
MGATLLVTADCGTSSIDEIATARNYGMDVIILDHHSVPPLLPAALAIVNPKRVPDSYAEPSAGGVCYYVLRQLREEMGATENESAMLELVALSTVCDLAPMVAGNRALVRDGLQALANTQRPGLQALMNVAHIDAKNVDTEALGFGLGPRINAAGRMAHARLAFDLLVSDDKDAARDIAAELDRLNAERRQATQDAVALAEELVAEEDADMPLLLIGHEDLPAGIVGLVASRLVEQYYRPAIVYQLGEEESRASARSIPEFDVTGALRSCSDLFVRFGGHRMAAGFTAENEQLPAIKEHLIARAGELLAGEDLTPALDIDAELPLREMRSDEIRWLNKLAPHGIENAEPKFMSRGVLVRDVRSVGKDGDHLKLKLKDGAVTWPAIAFRQRGDGIAQGTLVDLVWTLTRNDYGQGSMELNVLDLRPASPTG